MEEKKKGNTYDWMVADNIRKLVIEMNSAGIKKSDIISLVYNKQYILVYSK